MTTARKQDRDPLVGARIDSRYIIKGVLGRGGMGVVYDGVHEGLGRAVAIKVLGPGVAGNPTAVQRFLREARTASQLTHGNIVDVSDLGTLPDGRPYLVMAKLHGTDLCTLLERDGPQSPQRTVELLRGAAAALDLVHAKGYVHRDVKPENLMHVVREDGSEAVLLLDFGIVGLISPDAARLTAEGLVFGTPGYIAPELVRGDPPTPRADIYALATVAFELITGRAPFKAQNVLQLLHSKLGQAAPSLSDIAGFALDDAIEQVIATSLSRDPATRHASAGAFIAALHAATLEPRHQPQSQEHALGDDARERSRQGTGALEPKHQPQTQEHALGDAPPEPAQPEADALEPKHQTQPQEHALSDAPLEQALQPKHQTQPQEHALSDDARARLQQGTGALELSMDPSAPPAAAEPVRTFVPQTAPAGVKRPGRTLGAVAAVVVLGLLLWLYARPTTPAEPPVFVTPAPIDAADKATEPQVAPEPAAQPALPAPSTTEPAAEEPPAPKAAPATRPSRMRSPARKPTPQQPPERSAPQEPPEPGPQAPSASALVSAAQDALVQGHFSAALALYEQAARADGRNAAAYRGLGLVHERLGHRAAALRALRRAVALAPDDPKNALIQTHIQKLETAR